MRDAQVAFLEDRENWVSLDEAMARLGAGARLTKDPTFPRRVGEEAVRQHAASQVSTLLRSLGSPEAVLAATATASGKFSTVTEMAPVEAESGHALVRAVAREPIWPDEGRTTDALLREADAAMYRDKLRA